MNLAELEKAIEDVAKKVERPERITDAEEAQEMGQVVRVVGSVALLTVGALERIADALEKRA
jgi:hypothetical protein